MTKSIAIPMCSALKREMFTRSMSFIFKTITNYELPPNYFFAGPGEKKREKTIAKTIVATRYSNNPAKRSPWRDIGIITLRVIGWHTNIEAEIPPTHERLFSKDCGRILTIATVPMQMRKGTIIHVVNHRLSVNINTVLAMARNAYVVRGGSENRLCRANNSPAMKTGREPITL